MSTEKDACMNDITETQSTVEPGCSQIKKKRKKKRRERSWDASGDALASDFVPENTSGGKDNNVNEAGVDANSKENSDRTQEMDLVTLQVGVKKKTKRNKGLNAPQPAKLLPSKEEGQHEKMGNVSRDSLADISATENGSGESVVYVNPGEVDTKLKIDSNTTPELIILPAGGKGRKKRKNDEEQLEMIQKISSDSQVGISAIENTVDATATHVNGDGIDTKSEKDLNTTTQPTEPATVQEGGKKKKKRKDRNSSQPAELLTPQGNGCLEMAQNNGIDQDIIPATENTTIIKDSYVGCVDEVKVDNNSKNGSSNTEAKELGTCQEGGKKKKTRKKAQDSSQPTELISSQEEGQLEKIEKASSCSQPDISGTGNLVDEAEVNAKPKIDLSGTHATESATLQKGGKKVKKKKKKRDSCSPQSTEVIASQEKGTLESTQNVDSDPQVDLSETKNTFTEKSCCIDETEFDANLTKDLDRSQSTILFALQEEGKRRKKKQKENSNCSEPIQLPTSDDEGKRKKKRKKDSHSSGPRELHESQEEERVEKTQNFSSDSQHGLSVRDNASIVEHSCMNETDVDTCKKIDANSSQATESIELREEGKERKKHKKGLNCLQHSESVTSQEGRKKKKQKSYLNDASHVELSASLEEERVKKKRKKHLQDLNPTELSVSPGVGGTEPNSASQDEEDTHGNGAEADVENTNEISLTLEGRTSSSVCIGKGSAEKDGSDHKPGLVSVEDTTLDCVERGKFRVYSRKMRTLDGSIEFGLEPITGHVSGEHSGDRHMKDALNGDQVREEYSLANAVDFVLSDIPPSKFPKEDVMSEGIKKMTKREDEVVKIATGSLMDHSNDTHPAETVDMMPDRDLLPKESAIADAVKMVGVKNNFLDDCPKENILEADRRKKKQKLKQKDGIMTSEGREGGHADDAVKGLVEAKENSGVLQAESGSLIHASNVPSGKDDCNGEPGTSVELTNANDFLKKDEIGACSMKSIKHGSTQPGTEPITGYGQTAGGHSDEEHPSQFMGDVLIGEQTGEYSALMEPVILTDCPKEGAVCEELEITAERVTGRSSENCSNGHHLGKHSPSVKGLEMTIVKNADSSCSNVDVSQKESETATEMMNDVNVHVPTERESTPREPTIPITRPPYVRDGRKLLILDVNGLLADLVPHSERPASRKPDYYLRGKSVYRRPYCVDFLSFCFKNFEVGVWSSRKGANLAQVVKCLFGGSRRRLLFCWDRSCCTISGLATLDNPEKPLVLKELKRLWDWKNCPWRRGHFDASNTLLLDDSPYKALRNPVHTAVFPHTYKCTDDEDSALGREGDIRKYLERIIEAPNVQEFVSQNPFGQKPIRASDPSWPFYRKIIIGDN